MICSSGGSESRLAKAAGEEPFGQMRDSKLQGEAHAKFKTCKTHRFGALLEVEMLRKCASLWRAAHFQVKSAKI